MLPCMVHSITCGGGFAFHTNHFNHYHQTPKIAAFAACAAHSALADLMSLSDGLSSATQLQRPLSI